MPVIQEVWIKQFLHKNSYFCNNVLHCCVNKSLNLGVKDMMVRCMMMTDMWQRDSKHSGSGYSEFFSRVFHAKLVSDYLSFMILISLCLWHGIFMITYGLLFFSFFSWVLPQYNISLKDCTVLQMYCSDSPSFSPWGLWSIKEQSTLWLNVISSANSMVIHPFCYFFCKSRNFYLMLALKERSGTTEIIRIHPLRTMNSHLSEQFSGINKFNVSFVFFFCHNSCLKCLCTCCSDSLSSWLFSWVKFGFVHDTKPNGLSQTKRRQRCRSVILVPF